MPISILIPTYDDVSLLPDTLAPLLRDEATAEIVVVVDGARDGSYELLLEMASGEERIRPFRIENRGQAGARDYGLKRIRHEVVLMLDADVIARHGLVSGHARYHADGRDRVVVGYMPTVVPPRRRGTFVIERYARQYELACRAYDKDPAAILGRLWLGNVSVTRRALFAAGGCDNSAGVRYCDDNELGLRLASSGLDIESVFDRSLLAEHRFERSVPGFLKTSRTFGEDLVILEQLHPGHARFPAWQKSRVGRVLARFASRPRGYSALRRISLLGLAASGRLRAWPVESRLGALLDRLEVQRGIQAGLRRNGAAMDEQPGSPGRNHGCSPASAAGEVPSSTPVTVSSGFDHTGWLTPPGGHGLTADQA